MADPTSPGAGQGERKARWFDHRGFVIEAPWVDEERQTTFGRFDRLTHAVFGAQSEQPQHQAITLCGRRAGEIPGRGAIDCPECLETLA